MRNVPNVMYPEMLNTLEQDYVREGYVVIKQPTAEQLPFDLFGYLPDLIATKPGSGIILQVQASKSFISIDRVQQLSHDIAARPGWRFMLVTLEDVDADAIPTTADELPTWQQLLRNLDSVSGLLDRDTLEPALLYLWRIFEASLRRRAIDQHIPVERLPSAKLLDYMYSQGEVSVKHIDLFHDFLKQWNRIAHGANDTVEPSFVLQLVSEVHALLTDWCEPTATRDIASN
ncbi:MAG: hypothetical protein ABIT83_02275 [Massilia sp.]